jgi:hypothetical protein
MPTWYGLGYVIATFRSAVLRKAPCSSAEREESCSRRT